MSIRAVSHQEFDNLRGPSGTLADLRRKTVEWFADDTDIMLGMMVHHDCDLWSVIILGRKGHETFQVVDLDFGFRDPDDARRLLFEKMEAVLAVIGPVTPCS